MREVERVATKEAKQSHELERGQPVEKKRMGPEKRGRKTMGVWAKDVGVVQQRICHQIWAKEVGVVQKEEGGVEARVVVVVAPNKTKGERQEVQAVPAHERVHESREWVHWMPVPAS